MHFGGAGVTISITHSNISNTPFGLMRYGGTGVNLTPATARRRAALTQSPPGLFRSFQLYARAGTAPEAGPSGVSVLQDSTRVRESANGAARPRA